MIHVKVKHKPIAIQSINTDKGNQISDLELFFLITQELIQGKIRQGKKGVKLDQDHKMSYKKAQGVLFDLYNYFAVKGCFSFGICGTCENFGNGVSSNGTLGMCKGREKNWCDTCNNHSTEGGGFGL